MLYRLWGRIILRHTGFAGLVRAEPYEFGGVKGRSALDACWESASAAGIEGRKEDSGLVTVLLDLSKCYERIPLEVLVRRTVEAGWPRRVVAVAISQYAAVRWVTVAGATAPGGRATHGMIAGCALAVKFLAAFLREPIYRSLGLTLEDIEIALGMPPPVEGIRTYVDDLKLTKVGPPAHAAEGLRDMVVGLKRELDHDGMKLEFSKCQALGTTPAHRRALKEALGAWGSSPLARSGTWARTRPRAPAGASQSSRAA